MSDSHGNTPAIEKALSLFRRRDISVILHAGDFGTPENISLFSDFKLNLVKGNTDSLEELQFYAEKFGQPEVLEAMDLSVNNKSIFLFHGDNSGVYREALARNYNYIVRGHSHYPEDVKMGETRIINPGALYRSNQYSVGLLDIGSDIWSIVNLEGENINGKVF